MKRVKKIKIIKKCIKWFCVLTISVIAFVVTHKIATSDRGYNALGGEVFMLMIPFFVWAAPEIKKSIKEIKDELSR